MFLRPLTIVALFAIIGCGLYEKPIADNNTNPTTEPQSASIAAPKTLKAKSGVNTVELSWELAVRGIDSVSIERKKSGDDYEEVGSTEKDATTYVDDSVPESGKYYYRVRAKVGKDYSDYSGDALVTVTLLSAPTPPSVLEATPSTGTIDLMWQDNSDDEEKFEIQRKSGGGSFTDLASVEADVMDYADASVTAGTTYTYRVRAMNAAGTSSWSKVVTATATSSGTGGPTGSTGTTGSVPVAPSGLWIMKMANGLMPMWDDKSSDETGFEIERREGAAGTFAKVKDVGANVEDWTDTGPFKAATQYGYRVRAKNAAGYSAYSNIASETP